MLHEPRETVPGSRAENSFPHLLSVLMRPETARTRSQHRLHAAWGSRMTDVGMSAAEKMPKWIVSHLTETG